MREKTEHSEISIDDKMFDSIINTLQSKEYVKIGVLGKSPVRSTEGPSNAELAATHEFGKDNIPQRSFLRLTAHTAGGEFQSFVDENSENILKAITENRWTNVLEKFGAKWVEFVTDTFENQGYGKWPPLADITLLRRVNPKKLSLKQLRKTSKMLQDTGALLRSITYEVGQD